MKLNKLGYTKVEILVIVILLGIVAFITINKTSYAFAINSSSAYNDVKKLIEIQAVDYATSNLELFRESDTTFISVNDLLDNGYLIANSDGLVTSPSDSSRALNDNKIKLEYDKNKNVVNAFLVE